LAKDAAESANRLKSQFLAVMSHELRTPLNAILGFSEIIRDTTFGRGEELWDRYCDYARSVHDSGEHLLMLISDVLDLSKLEAGSYSLYIERIDLAEIVKSSLDIVRSQARRAKVRLAEFEPTGDLHLDADYRALKQITLNLLSNAVKFTPPDGEVAVSVDASEDRIVLCVRDTGIGIAHEHLDKVFDAFHQGDARLSRRYEGTGLGLSISRGLAEMHGGTVDLESELGIGTRVTVSLPRSQLAKRIPESSQPVQAA
jgi:signal transduction histidine kinase